MSTLLIRRTQVIEYTGYCNNSGQHCVEIKCRASWSDTVCEELGWEPDPKGFGTGALEGKLFGVNMILEPNSKNLKDYRFDIPISQVSKFKHIVKMEEGEVSGRELEFVITTVAEDAAAVLKNFVQHCGPGGDRGQCKIQYNSEEQQKLDVEPEAEQTTSKPRGRQKSKEAVQ
jgi:hypothetical protein